MINLDQKYTPRINPGDADYPFGSIKGDSSPGAGDGTPLSSSWGNDIEGFRQAVMTEAGKTPSGQPDNAHTSQLWSAMKDILRQEVPNMGWTPVEGSFEAGGTITARNQILWWEAAASWYSWQGDLTISKVVLPGSTPATSGGVSSTAWVDRTDGALRDELADNAGMSLIGLCQDVETLRSLSGLTVGRKVQLAGYYSDTPGVGGGVLIVTSDTTSADNGGTIFVTSDGVRVKRERKLRLKASDFGVVGDWNGTAGTDNRSRIEAMIAASNSSQSWEIDLDNVGVSTIQINGKDGWKGFISGSVVNISAKPAVGATDEKDAAGGVLPTFKITNCDNWKIKGGSVDNRYREAFWVENCNNFVNECDVIGFGLNNNLHPNYYRYCRSFRLRGFRHEATSEKPATGYYAHCNNINLWDCSNFKILDFEVEDTGSNGVYVGSNCKDYLISGFNINSNAMSAIQLAWSSFGVFPYRGVIESGFTNGNRADGIDVNNTSGSVVRIDTEISNIVHANNGYNDDGTVTVDGSGIGTFMNVSHWSVTNCRAVDNARAGLFVKNCTNWNVSGCGISKQKTTNNTAEGVYLEGCSDYTIEKINVITQATQEALKLYGAHSSGKIGGVYNGTIAISAPDATTSYTDMSFYKATLYTTAQVVARFKFVASRVYSTSDAIYALADIIDTDARSTSGTATTVGANGVSVVGGRHRGSANGIQSVGFSNVLLQRVNGIADTTGAGVLVNGGNKVTIEHSSGSSTSGAGNSIRVSNTTTKVIFIGNTTGTGTADVAASTYTLKDF